MKNVAKYAALIKKIPSQYILIGILTMLTTIGIITGVYYFRQSVHQTSSMPGQTQETNVKIVDIVSRVGKLMELPEGVPTVATVTDVTKLANQPFFERAANGDIVLVYEDTRKAIMYRPSTNRIIEVATITLGQNLLADQPAPTPTPTPGPTPIPVRVAIRNGTATIGLSKKLEDELMSKRGNITVVEKDNAKDSDWRSTAVVDVTGKNEKATSEIANLISARIVTIPDNEPKPQADILIIIGADRK
jgi:hypothetical protein